MFIVCAYCLTFVLVWCYLPFTLTYKNSQTHTCSVLITTFADEPDELFQWYVHNSFELQVT